MQQEDIVALTADIVATHVANNSVPLADVGYLIENVHAALSSLAQPAPEPEPEKRTPAVPVRQSVKRDHVVCLACGARQKTLKRHLAVAHDLAPAQYRAEFGLPASYPMVAPAYAEQRRALALAAGLGRKSKRRASAGRKRPAQGRGTKSRPGRRSGR